MLSDGTSEVGMHIILIIGWQRPPSQLDGGSDGMLNSFLTRTWIKTSMHRHVWGALVYCSCTATTPTFLLVSQINFRLQPRSQVQVARRTNRRGFRTGVPVTSYCLFCYRYSNLPSTLDAEIPCSHHARFRILPLVGYSRVTLPYHLHILSR